MASKNMGLVSVLVVAMLWSGAAAQSTTCTNLINTLAPCLDFVTGTVSTPTPACCTNLASAVSAHPECLCEALSLNSIEITFNQTQVIALPGACNITTPSLSTCNAESPASPPAGKPNATGSGSNTVPSTQGNGSSDVSSTKMSASLLFVLFVAAFAML